MNLIVGKCWCKLCGKKYTGNPKLPKDQQICYECYLENEEILFGKEKDGS